MPKAKPAILVEAFKLNPKAAADYFREKGYAYSWDWTDTYGSAHQTAFTVAKVIRLDILQAIRAELQKALNEGTTFADFQNTLEPRLKKMGWWGLAPDPKDPSGQVQLGSPERLKTIFDTNIQGAYGAGRWKQIEDGKKARPYVQYSAILDGATRPAHRLLHQRVYAADDQALSVIAPPNGWKCRCTLVSVSPYEMERDGLTVQEPPTPISREVVISEKTGEVKTVKGIQLKDGSQFFPDAGFDFNPGMRPWKPDLAKYDKDLVAAYHKGKKEKAPPLKEQPVVAGLAARFPIRKNSDFGALLSAYDTENSGEFVNGFKKFTPKNTTKYFLAVNKAHEIFVSTRTWASGFSPMRELKSAVTKIAKGNALTFHEEYAIEGLWHEIGHARSKGWEKMSGLGLRQMVMEAVNQFTARMTYPEFITALGGKAAHAQEVLEKGYGYSHQVRNFRSIFSHLGISDKEALDITRPISVETKWTLIPEKLANDLANLKGKPELSSRILEAMRRLNIRDVDEFKTGLNAVLGAAQ